MICPFGAKNAVLKAQFIAAMEQRPWQTMEFNILAL